MFAEIGHFALILALCVALAQVAVPWVGLARNNRALIAFARPAAYCQFLLCAVAFVALMHAFAVSDFSLMVVAENSHTTKPLLYKISGTWGNHEGSLLLWVLVSTFFAAACARFGKALPEKFLARVLMIQSAVGAGFLMLSLFTSNPFLRLFPAPADGQGLNPLLQHPGLAFHPPMLYLGYVGFSLTFSFSLAALLEGRVGPAWARWVRPWALTSWAFLTVGIALGAWWAYTVLGWGGFWFWDPVENAAFVPWLAGTAFLHSVIVVEKRNSLKSWAILLGLITFAFSLVGTFLVRSGVLTSVHSFASDPTRGYFILLYLVIVLGVSFLIYGLKAQTLVRTASFKPVSRESAIVLNNILLATMAGVVFVGTLYPLVLEAVTGEKISVGAPYFNAVFTPLACLLLPLMAVSPFVAWKRARLLPMVQRLGAALVVAVAAAGVSLFVLSGKTVGASGGVFLGVLAIGSSVMAFIEKAKPFRGSLASRWQRARGLPLSLYGSFLAHAGVGVVVIGVTCATLLSTESVALVKPGTQMRLKDHVATFEGAQMVRGPNYRALQGRFSVTSPGLFGGQKRFDLVPESRGYDAPPMTIKEPAIKYGLGGDVYLVIAPDEARKGLMAWFYLKPFVGWIWAGAFLMFGGAALSLADRRLRLGAPGGRRVAEANAARGEASKGEAVQAVPAAAAMEGPLEMEGQGS